MSGMSLALNAMIDVCKSYRLHRPFLLEDTIRRAYLRPSTSSQDLFPDFGVVCIFMHTQYLRYAQDKVRPRNLSQVNERLTPAPASDRVRPNWPTGGRV